MGKRVFNTEFAPADEVEGVKEALERAGIPFYEINNSKLWLGGGSLCVTDPSDHDRARGVIEQFQHRWRQRAGDGQIQHRVNWVVAVPLLVLFGVFIAATIHSIIS